jgi:hypothetical protein
VAVFFYPVAPFFSQIMMIPAGGSADAAQIPAASAITTVEYFSIKYLKPVYWSSVVYFPSKGNGDVGKKTESR